MLKFSSRATLSIQIQMASLSLTSASPLPEQTPSKKVWLHICFTKVQCDSSILQAAAALAALNFNPPTPESLNEEPEDDILPIRRKFVGDVDLPESMCLLFMLFVIYRFNLSFLFSGEEPLLKESRRRFVLFPIQYHEVRVLS